MTSLDHQIKTPGGMLPYGNLPEGVDPMYFILNEANVAINYCTADLIYAFTNKKHASMHGMTPEEVIGKHVVDIIGAEANELVRPYYERALKGERLTYEIEAKFLTGDRYIQSTYTPVWDGMGQVIGWVTATIDMTERRKLEKKLQESEAQLRLAKEKAEAANIAKSEFLANMSHELRTPMNAIIGLVDIMNMKEYPPEKQKEYLGVMQTSAHHLLALINDVLDVSKLEAEQALHIAPFDLAEVLQEVLITQKVHAKRKGYDILLEVHGAPAGRFLGDELRLRQVLLNLVSNAIKFTERGSVKIITEYAEAAMDADTQDVTISIEDTGIGISEKNIQTIFNKFTQADSSISRIYGGTGLGLFICKELIEAMNGTLNVESEMGRGSRFSINLSLPVTLENANPQAIEEDAQPAQQRKNAHILLVEDNVGNIMVTSSFLENYGYSYEIARNGKEALQKFSEQPFDAVLMDVQMPELDGFSATRLIRQREQETKLRHTPIIGLTAYALKGDKERCLEAGMDDYLAKPFDPENLFKVLSRVNNQTDLLAAG